MPYVGGSPRIYAGKESSTLIRRFSAGNRTALKTPTCPTLTLAGNLCSGFYAVVSMGVR
jgi:hypothetical protein